MRVIDVQSHWYPPVFCEAQLGRTEYPLWERVDEGYVMRPAPGVAVLLSAAFTDLDRQLQESADAGVDTLVSSPAVFGDVSALELSAAREMALLVNEQQAAAESEHPGRFYGLAVLPMQDCSAAIEVLDDAVDRLGLRSVIVHSNVAGATIASDDLRPLYAHAARRQVPLFLHPGAVQPPERVLRFGLDHPLSFMFDTTVAAASLILSGTLDAVPDLDVVHPHLGGTLPYLVDRLDIYREGGRWELERPFREYLQSFYTDTVSGSAAALSAAVADYGVDRVMFASDRPYFPVPGAVTFVRRNLDSPELEQVLGANAARLLRLDAEASR